MEARGSAEAYRRLFHVCYWEIIQMCVMENKLVCLDGLEEEELGFKYKDLNVGGLLV